MSEPFICFAIETRFTSITLIFSGNQEIPEISTFPLIGWVFTYKGKEYLTSTTPVILWDDGAVWPISDIPDWEKYVVSIGSVNEHAS